MITQLITIQPQIIQFSRQNTQFIKIINNSTQTLTNFFFCLYNVQKFSFQPQTFQLAPKQHKLIKITLKIKNGKSIAKQFAYLKSNDVNKRLTLLINNFQSPDEKQKFTTQEGYSDMNTLSSRDYHQLHTRALNKIVKEQQKYIANSSSNDFLNLNTTGGQNLGLNSSNKKQQMYNRTENFNTSQKKFTQYTQELEIKATFLQKQVQELNGILNQKCIQLQRIAQENVFLEQQGSKFLKKLSDKQQRISQLEDLYQKMIQQNQKYSRQMQYTKQEMRRKQNEQKDQQFNQLRSYQSRIKQLQNIVSLSQSTERQQIQKFKKEFKERVTEKDEQLIQIRKTLQHQELLVKQHQINILKLQNQKRQIQETKQKLEQTNKQISQLNNNLREQVFVYKSKVQQNSISNSKVQEYLQIALQTYKNQNQTLKRSKNELERSLQNFVKTNRQTDQNMRNMSLKVDQLNKQLIKMREQLAYQQSKNQELKNQNHRKIIQIKNQNLRLLQRLTEQQSTKRQEIISRLNRQIQQKDEEINKINFKLLKVTKKAEDLSELQKQNEKLQQQNQKLQQKVKKYKKQTKKQLKSINDNAFDELKRIHQQKKQLTKKVNHLQKTLQQISNNSRNYENDKTRKNGARSRSRIQKTQFNDNQEENDYSRSKSNYQVPRKIGIHKQRKYLEQSRQNSVNNQPSQVNLYELYELREFENYIRNQQQKFQHIFNLGFQLMYPLDYNGKPLENVKPLYRAIKFFKVIQMKLKSLNQKIDQSVILNKQNQFLREKLTDLQKREQNLSMNQRQAEESQSILNKTYLRNANPLEIIQFMKQQMKKQYNKQKQSLKFSEDKYQILKKKIYRQYRTRIIQLLNLSTNKKDRNSTNYMGLIAKIEDTIERFIENLSNLSHKQAILGRQIKIKQNLKTQNSKLRQKINQLQHIINQKHTYCNRDPIKVINCSNLVSNGVIKEQQWIQSIKLSTQLLTSKAQSERLMQQLQIVRQDCNDLRQQLNELNDQNDKKDDQIIKLKKDQLQLERTYEKELQKQNTILQETKNKLFSTYSESKGKNKTLTKEKQKQFDSLKQQLQKKTQQLKGYKEKQKKWQEYLEETTKAQEKQKKLSNSYRRLEQNTAILNQQNKQLRSKNQQFKQEIQKLQKQLQKNKLYIKNLKGEQQQNRIKPHRIQQSLQQIKQLEQALKSSKQELFKLKKNKDRQIVKLQGDIISAKNEALIQIKSFQSIIRAMIETMRKLYASLKIIIKKKGLSLGSKLQFSIPQNLIQINASQIYDQFQQILEILEI